MPIPPDPDKVAALQTAVDQYHDECTRAELIKARAEVKMAAAIKEARSLRGRPIPWRIIADMFGTTHQAVMSKWQDRMKNLPPSATVVVPSTRTEPNNRSSE